MLKTPARPIAAIAGLCLTLMVAGPASVASAQSDSDLRKENQRLRTRVRDLERELDAAQNRIGELEREVARLLQMIEALRARPLPSTTSPAPSKVTIDESIPHASPRALFKAVVKSYEQEIESLEIDADDPRQSTVYLRALQRWAAGVNREFRSPIDWHVRVLDGEGTRHRATVKLRAVDPITHAHLGEAFDVRLSRTLARRLEEQLSRQKKVLVVRGTLIPGARVNELRTDRGVFDKPKFIGPYAELDFTVEVASFMPAQPPPPPPQPR